MVGKAKDQDHTNFKLMTISWLYIALNKKHFVEM